jgi:hypothetical protein
MINYLSCDSGVQGTCYVTSPSTMAAAMKASTPWECVLVLYKVFYAAMARFYIYTRNGLRSDKLYQLNLSPF